MRSFVSLVLVAAGLVAGCQNTYDVESVGADGGVHPTSSADGAGSARRDGGAPAATVTCGTTPNVDLSSDPAHCGGCATACPTGSSCTTGVCCPAGSVLCGGACVDTTVDANHCGACGDACGGTCQASRCVVTLASGQKGPTSIAVDAQDVYWTTYGLNETSNDGAVARVPLAGGATVTLAAGRKNPWEVVVANGTVYWNDRAANGVYGMPATGGSVTTLAVTSAALGLSPYGIAADAGSVYWTNYFGGVSAAPVTGAGPTRALAPADGYLRQVVVDGARAYWSVYDDAAGKILSVPLGGGAITTLASGQGGAEYLALYGGQLYWTDGVAKTVMAVPVAGGSTVTLASNQGNPGSIAADGAGLYWLNRDDGTVVVLPHSGGTPQVLVMGQPGPTAIAVDAQNVYWTDFGDGTVRKVSK